MKERDEILARSRGSREPAEPPMLEPPWEFIVSQDLFKEQRKLENNIFGTQDCPREELTHAQGEACSVLLPCSQEPH